MTQSREQFEAHYDGWTNSGCGYSLHHRMGNSYDLPDISKAWAHWQASRDALVIDIESLSISFDTDTNHEDCGPPLLDRDDVAGVIRASGIKTNPPT